MNTKKMSETKTIQTHLILPGDTNRHNTLYGGNLMRMIDNVAAISFTRLTRSMGVTASMDVLNFIKPLPVSHSVCIETMVSGVGNRSVEVFVKVIGEDLKTGDRYLAATAFLTFVVIDDLPEGGLPQIVAETDEERYIMSGYEERKRHRKESRQHDEEFQKNISIDFPWVNH
ncbi:acyl-CoA thioesterase [Aerococcaceae bacterium WGS1372]